MPLEPLRHSDKDERHRGEYKTLRNDVGAFDAAGNLIGIVFETATPFDTPRRMTELAVKILDYVRENGRVATRDMVRETSASPNTLKATFSSLVAKGLLVRHGGGRSTWYALP